MTLKMTIARQMVGAELLRLRKKRSLVGLVLLLVVGPIAIALGYNAIQHASAPANHGPAGGLHSFIDMLDVLGLFMGPVAAALIGAEAGAGDLATGVFRDNVVTGRSRLALFAAKLPAALTVSLVASAIGFAVAVAGTLVFAGGLPTPDAALILQSAAWVALANTVVCLVAVGIGSATGSRPMTITALIGWQLVLSPLLVRAASLGSARDGLLDGVLVFLRPGPANGAPTLTMAVGVAVLVLALWTLVIPTVGAWRTQTRDA
jgi:ABC-type transport system involved in multi-copper enzyme maturation permease subunit